MDAVNDIRGSVLVIAVAFCLLVGCEAGDSSSDEEDSSSREEYSSSDERDPSRGGEESSSDVGGSHPADERVFHGTPAEYMEALVACYQGHGLPARLSASDPTSMRLDHVDPDVQAETRELCMEEVGAWTRQSPPDEYMERVYEHLTWQRECLTELGYDLPPPPTFERFLETQEFDPMGDTGVEGPDFLVLESECPRFEE